MQKIVEYTVSNETPLGWMLVAREYAPREKRSKIMYLSLGSSPAKMSRECRETLAKDRRARYKFIQSSAGFEICRVVERIVWRYIAPPADADENADYNTDKNLTDAEFVDRIGGVDISHGTVKQQQIWTYLLYEIPRGRTKSYGQIAVNLYRSAGMSQIVGQACARNRIALLIPCHRVQGAKGALTGFRWEIWRKQALLVKELDTLDVSCKPIKQTVLTSTYF
ncbi:6-O-methylguanine DNA methyltransferase [Lipomyces arxii]|uniref:6-O-methylguanine DNA methyltransferase n=1 Tax=Lipomyces arxii TaxID=56418 RepID=UPI0034CF23D0